MRYNDSIQRMQQDPRYQNACNLLDALLRCVLPESQDLVALYGIQHAQVMRGVFERHLESHPEGFGQRRPHVDKASTEISDARSQVEEGIDFQRLQLRVLFGDLPDAVDLEPLYGHYAEEVREIIRLFLKYRLSRKCGISSVAHLSRVGAVVRRLGMDNDGGHVYSTVGFMHDALEDLLERVPDAHGEPYGVHGYQQFLDQYTSPELHSHLRMVTNFYDLLLTEADKLLRKKDKAVTKENVLHVLEEMYRFQRVDIHPYIEKIHYVLEDARFEDGLIAQAKWLCYSELYIREMAIYTHTAGDYRTFEIKAIDLSDNGHGRESLALDSRIKNLIKHQSYATYGNMLNSTWHGLNKRVGELQEDALVHSEHMIIQDLLQRQSYMDFAVSAIHKIQALRSILFLPERKLRYK
ncbi:MAG: hypothetical protein M5R41_02015 [Bacteroidia bacterium]|nr:hypothetical protein [Bacteroidia bacterium]